MAASLVNSPAERGEVLEETTRAVAAAAWLRRRRRGIVAGGSGVEASESRDSAETRTTAPRRATASRRRSAGVAQTTEEVPRRACMASNRMTRAARVSRAVEASGRPAVVAAPESPGSARHAHGSRVADLGDENIGRIKARNQHWGGATLKAPRVCAMSLLRTALGRALLARPVVARAAATRAYCAPTTLAEGAETEEGEFSQHTDAEVAFEVSEPTFMTTLTFSRRGSRR